MESPVSVVLESAKDLLMPNPVIAAHDVSVVFHNGSRQFIALDRVSAQFHAGEVVLLMGASGSGKTTLLSLLGCLRSPDAGCVELLGEDLGRASGTWSNCAGGGSASSFSRSVCFRRSTRSKTC
jgi:ABC-type transporter Mla maintaining outer membrane lipid asymmetry ATPase subunit MlaF